MSKRILWYFILKQPCFLFLSVWNQHLSIIAIGYTRCVEYGDELQRGCATLGLRNRHWACVGLLRRRSCHGNRISMQVLLYETTIKTNIKSYLLWLHNAHWISAYATDVFLSGISKPSMQEMDSVINTINLCIHWYEKIAAFEQCTVLFRYTWW